MDALLMTQTMRATLSLDDTDAVGRPLMWVTVWQERVLERHAEWVEFERMLAGV